MKSLIRLLSDNPFLVAICGLTLYHCILFLAWHKIDHRPPRWDESHYLMLSEHSYQALQKHQLIQALSLKGFSDTKTGLVPFLSALSYPLVGESEKRATFIVNAVSFMVLCWALLRIGKRLTGQYRVGAVAWLLFGSLPSVAVFSCYYTVDMALTAAVATTVWLCQAVEDTGFQGWRYPALLGVTVALGMGFKHLSVAFAAGPLALLSVRALIDSWQPFRFRASGRWRLFACLGCGILLGSLYHLLNFHVIREQWLRSHKPVLTGGFGTPPGAWPTFVSLLVSPPLPLVAWVVCGGLALIQLAVQRKWEIAYVLLAIVGGYLGVAQVSSYPLSYYFFPLLPLLCLLVCCPLALRVPFRWETSRGMALIRSLATTAVVLGLVCFQVNRLFGTANPVRVALKLPAVLFTRGRLTSNPMALTDYWTGTSPDGNQGSLPYPQYWPVQEMLGDIVHAIDKTSLGRNRRYIVGAFTASHEYLSIDYQNFKIWQMHWNDFLITYPVPMSLDGEETTESPLSSFDFLFVKSGPVCKACFVGQPAKDAYQAFAASLTAGDYQRLRAADYTLLGRHDLPDGSVGTVWCSPRCSPSVSNLPRPACASTISSSMTP